MRRLALLLAIVFAALAPAEAIAFDPTRYPSPTLNAPNVDRLVIQGTNSTGDVSKMSTAPSVSATPGTLARQLGDLGAGRMFVDSTGVMSGLTGANIAGSTGTSLFMRPTFNLTDGTTLYSASNDFSTPKGLELLGSRILLTPSDRVQILPKAGTLAHGLDVVQTGPASGSVAGPIALNSFDMTWSSKVTGAYGTPGLVGAGAIQGMVYGMNVGGPAYDAQQAFTLAAGLTHDRGDTSTGDKGAFSAGVHSKAPTNGLLDGIVSSVVADSGSSSPQIAGIELDMTILGTGTTLNRLGSVVVNTGSKQGTVADIAYALTTGGPDGVASGSFKTLLGLYKQDPSLPNAMPPEGRIFASDHALTISDILYGPNITVTGNILNFPGVILTGGGKLTTSQVDLYGTPPAVATGHVSYGGTTTAPSQCGSLAGAVGCVAINVGGTQRYIPYW